jgi:hypothetical protein
MEFLALPATLLMFCLCVAAFVFVVAECFDNFERTKNLIKRIRMRYLRKKYPELYVLYRKSLKIQSRWKKALEHTHFEGYGSMSGTIVHLRVLIGIFNDSLDALISSKDPESMTNDIIRVDLDILSSQGDESKKEYENLKPFGPIEMAYIRGMSLLAASEVLEDSNALSSKDVSDKDKDRVEMITKRAQRPERFRSELESMVFIDDSPDGDNDLCDWSEKIQESEVEETHPHLSVVSN